MCQCVAPLANRAMAVDTNFAHRARRARGCAWETVIVEHAFVNGSITRCVVATRVRICARGA